MACGSAQIGLPEGLGDVAAQWQLRGGGGAFGVIVAHCQAFEHKLGSRRNVIESLVN